jgi:hypothetical protein
MGTGLLLLGAAYGVYEEGLVDRFWYDLVRRKATGGLDGPDALRVVTGIVTFFLLLNIFFGLGGRYDMALAALGVGFLLWRLQRRPA